MFRGILIAFGLINFAFGLVALVDPLVVTAWSGLVVEGPAAAGEIRAVLGGVCAAVGILFLVATAVSNPKPILGTLALLFAGLSVGRISSLTIDGWSLYTAVGLVLELSIMAVTAFVWLQPEVLRDKQPATAGTPEPPEPAAEPQQEQTAATPGPDDPAADSDASDDA